VCGVNETWRGVTIFVAALVTIWLWAPLSSDASRTASGVIVTETYFGPLRYLTLHTELKEPDYTIQKRLNAKRLAVTCALSAALWSAVVWKVRRPAPETGEKPS
jgi:hypothetical protein